MFKFTYYNHTVITIRTPNNKLVILGTKCLRAIIQQYFINTKSKPRCARQNQSGITVGKTVAINIKIFNLI